MSFSKHIRAVGGALAVAAAAFGVPWPAPAFSQDLALPIRINGAAGRSNGRCPWLNEQLSAATRANELLRSMTPLEEADMLHLHADSVSDVDAETVSDREPGDVLVPYEGYSDPIPRLCVPRITEQDGAAGVASGYFVNAGSQAFDKVTQLPAPIADAAAFDPSLADAYGGVIGAEAAAKGIDMALAPTLNIERDPLWGRSYETLGEDPYLAAALAPRLVEGIQRHRVIAVVKHYVAYDQELARSTLADNAIVSPRALHEMYLPPFATAIQDGRAKAVMCSYNSINGTPTCQSSTLLGQILRRDWSFSGFVRSDCGSIYNGRAAMLAGVSQVKCTSYYNPRQLVTDIHAKKLTRARLDDAARPLLTALFEFNLIGRPHPPTNTAVATNTAHRNVAMRTDDEGAVLLKNDGLLPLDFGRLRSLALIGPDGGTPISAGFGALHVVPTKLVTALQALRGQLGARVRYSDGTDVARAVRLARSTQFVVVVVYDVEEERFDRRTLSLPFGQDRLVRAVEAANPRTVVVLETGAPVLLPWLSHTPALVETWYPGETAGSSLAALLSGRINPSGKLPVTFPSSETGRPNSARSAYGVFRGRAVYSDGIDVGYRWYQVHYTAPAFAFGFGLSYTTFAYSHLQVLGTTTTGLAVTAQVTNTGARPGTDIAQVYVGDPTGEREAPRQLKGFARVTLAAGRSATVRIMVTPGDLAVWSPHFGTWVVGAGTYRLWLGDASLLTDLPLTTTVLSAQLVLRTGTGPAVAQQAPVVLPVLSPTGP